MATSNNAVIISRIQNRRGLKQDLPKPLRSGEIGFATDTRQIYIGGDTDLLVNSGLNKIAQFEKTPSSINYTRNIANLQIIKFTVPSKFYAKGNVTWDGVTKTTAWLGSDVFKSSATVFKNLDTNAKFTSNDLNVTRDGVLLEGDDVTSSVSSVAASKDYAFIQGGTSASDSQNLGFRSAPLTTEEIGLTYYSNTTLISALSKTSPDTDVGNYATSVTSFYNDATLWTNLTSQVIPSYRKLNDKNIRVTPSTGIGYIGLEFGKHITPSTDVKYSPGTISYASPTLGKFFVSRNSDIQTAVSNVSISYTVSGSNIVIAADPTIKSYTTSAPTNYVYTSGATAGATTGWLGGKVLQVVAVNGTTNFTAAIPSNTATYTRVVESTDTEHSASNISFTAQDVGSISVNDGITFLYSGNSAIIDSGVVHAVTSASRSVTVDTLASSKGNLIALQGSNVRFITHSTNNTSKPVVYSVNHGFDNTETVNVSGSGAFGSAMTVASASSNAFVVTTSSPVTTGNSSLTVTPVLIGGTISVTPVVGVDLSSITITNGTGVGTVITTVNGVNNWPKISKVPNSDNTIYLTHAESFQKTPQWYNGFRIHTDSAFTANKLGLTVGNYDKSDATIKSKLESWLSGALAETKFNYFTSVSVGAGNTGIFANSVSNFNNYSLTIDEDLKEATFGSREEARDFATICNNVYFTSQQSGLTGYNKGLLNLKTNIELLTRDALEAGEAVTAFSSPESIAIPNGNGNNILTNLDPDAYNTFFVEYSMKDTNSNTSINYSRIGSVMFGADKDQQVAYINDQYSDSKQTISGVGNVNLVVSYDVSSDKFDLRADNSLSPSSSVTMNYIVRKWKS